MKSVIITLIIAITMVGGSTLYTSHLKKQSEALLRITENVKECIENEDYSAAKNNIKKLDKDVSRFEKFFLATGDHLEMDNIKINISELKSFIKHEMQGDALGKVYVLEFLFEHLPHNSRLRIGNIL